MNLPRGKERIDDGAGVIHGDIVENIDDPGLGVDLDIGHVDSRRRAHSLRIVKHRLVKARLQPVRKLVAEIGHARHRAKTQGRDVGAGNAEPACPIGNIRFIHFEHARRNLLRLGDDTAGGDMNAGSADRHRARVEGAVTGLDLPRVALHHVDMLDRNLQDVGGNLRKRCDMAMALTHGSRKDRDPAARVHADSRAFPTAAVEAHQRQAA